MVSLHTNQYFLIMKKSRLIIGLIVLCSYSTIVFAQQKCEVLKKDIAGSYSGDCKDGLANGSGESIGENQYKGEFKNGLPHGIGTMIYANGGVYTGNWKKGLRQGEGKYSFSRDGKESIKEGNWKKGKFVGPKKKRPYEIIRNVSVPRYTIRKVGDEYNRVTIKVKHNGITVPTPQNISVTSGNITNYQGNTSFENIMYFPFKCEMLYSMPSKLYASRHKVEFVFKINQPGDWMVEIQH